MLQKYINQLYKLALHRVLLTHWMLMPHKLHITDLIYKFSVTTRLTLSLFKAKYLANNICKHYILDQ